MGQGVGSEPQVLDLMAWFTESCEFLGGDGSADAEMEGESTFGEEFGGQARGANGGVNDTGEMERETVATLEEHGKHRGSGERGEACGALLPFGIGNAALLPHPTGNLAAGEDGESAIGFQPARGFTECAGIGGVALLPGMDVHCDDTVSYGRDGAKRVIRQKTEVVAERAENGAEGQSFEESEGVIGNDEQRSGGWDAFEVVGADDEFDAELAEHADGVL